MKRQGAIITLLLTAFIFTLTVSLLWQRRPNSQPSVAGSSIGENAVNRNISGIILPHHDLVKSLISQSLERLTRQQQYSYVVILGPNHFAPEKTPLATTTHLSEAKVAAEIVHRLREQFPLITDAQPLIEQEHSITLHLPYLKQYLPQAEIIPLMFSPTFTPEELERLAIFLRKNTPADTLYLASIDFSHESSVLEGLDKNAETLTVLQNFDYHTLYQFGDDNLDSPVAAAVFLHAMQGLGATAWETWHNTHAGIITDDPRTRGTSYLIGIFYR